LSGVGVINRDLPGLDAVLALRVETTAVSAWHRTLVDEGVEVSTDAFDSVPEQELCEVDRVRTQVAESTAAGQILAVPPRPGRLWIDEPVLEVGGPDVMNLAENSVVNEPLCVPDSRHVPIVKRDRGGDIYVVSRRRHPLGIVGRRRERFLAGLDAPLVLTSHGTSYDEARSVDPQSPPDYLFKYVFHPINVALDAVAGQFADHIIGVSDHTRDQLRDLYRFDADDLTTVPPGIDADRFQPTDEVHPAIDTDRESILVLSRLDPRKGSTRRSGRSRSLNGRTQSR